MCFGALGRLVENDDVRLEHKLRYMCPLHWPVTAIVVHGADEKSYAIFSSVCVWEQYINT